MKNILCMWPILLVGLVPQSALALSANEYSILFSDPSTGGWQASAVTEMVDDGTCRVCNTTVTVQMSITENGGWIWSGANSSNVGRTEIDYFSPFIVDLNSTYFVNSGHSYIDTDLQQVVGFSTAGPMTIPGLPSISLQSIDATNPNLATIKYSANPAVLYSSQVTLGNQASISGSPGNPNFYFNQNSYPGVGGGRFVTTTPIVFTGYMYGYYFGGPACSVTVNEQVNIYTDGGHLVMYTPGDPGIGGAGFVDVQHIVDGSTTIITYCTQPVGGSLTDRMLNAWGNLSTKNNSCVNVDCAISDMNEVHYYQTFSDALGPEVDPTDPPQGKQPFGGWYFLSREEIFSPPHWVPRATQSQICNTLVFIGDNIGAWGCTPLVWP